jgi:hypothetical protein
MRMAITWGDTPVTFRILQPVKFFDQMLNQERNVFTALAQIGQFEVHNPNTIV